MLRKQFLFLLAFLLTFFSCFKCESTTEIIIGEKEDFKDYTTTSFSKGVELSPCDNDPCGEEGVCRAKDDSYVCACFPPFRGKHCDSECGLPCGHGKCVLKDVDGVKQESCECYSGYILLDGMCQDMHACNSNPCQNNGTCRQWGSGYQCACLFPYTGKDCEIAVDPCDSQPCLNGGSCTSNLTDYACACDNQYDGKDCEKFCDCGGHLHDCSWTTNSEGKEAKLCKCAKTYEEIKGKCEACDCGGYKHTCNWKVGPFHPVRNCTCARGYAVKNGTCVEVDVCSPNPCQNNGTCRRLADGAPWCTCQDMYFGINCTSVSPCLVNPCKNNATCKSTGSDYDCWCQKGWLGKNCTHILIDTDPCQSNPCNGNSKCVSDGFSYSCQCDDLHGGVHCETAIESCDPNPCLNDGNCTLQNSTHSCICGAQFEGKHCESKTNGGLMFDVKRTSLETSDKALIKKDNETYVLTENVNVKTDTLLKLLKPMKDVKSILERGRV